MKSKLRDIYWTGWDWLLARAFTAIDARHKIIIEFVEDMRKASENEEKRLAHRMFDLETRVTLLERSR